MIPRRDIHYFQQQRPEDLAMSVATSSSRERIGLPPLGSSSTANSSHRLDHESLKKPEQPKSCGYIRGYSALVGNDLQKQQQQLDDKRRHVPIQETRQSPRFDGSKSDSALDSSSLDQKRRPPTTIPRRPASFDTKRRGRGLLRRGHSSIHSERDRVLLERDPHFQKGSNNDVWSPVTQDQRQGSARNNSSSGGDQQHKIQATSLSIKALPREESMLHHMDEN